MVSNERSGPVWRPWAGWKVSRLCWEVTLVILRMWQSMKRDPSQWSFVSSEKKKNTGLWSPMQTLEPTVL